VQRRADAGVGLRARHHQPPDPQAGQQVLQAGGLEGVAVVLLDQRLRGVRLELGHDPPAVAAVLELVVGVLDPDDRHLLAAGALDQAADVGHHGVALVGAGHHVVLHVDHDQRRRGPVHEGRHGGTQAQGGTPVNTLLRLRGPVRPDGERRTGGEDAPGGRLGAGAAPDR
jgi:hypothetical protein